MTRRIPRFVPLAAVLAALMAPPAAAKVLFGGNCSTALAPTPEYQVAVGNVNFPGDGRVATGSPTGRNVTLNDRLVTGDHPAVTGNASGRRLQIQGMPGGTADFVRRGKNNCVEGSPRPQFYSTTFGGVYEHTQPLGMSIKPCPYRWLAPKCSRTVNLGVLGTYTANKGAPPCGDNTQQTDPGGFTVMPRTTGVPDGTTFNIRVYGKLCSEQGQSIHHCRKFLPSGGTEGVGASFSCLRAHLHGYTATFAPGPNCSEPEWPTQQNKDAYMAGDERYLPYARWCDFTVTVP